MGPAEWLRFAGPERVLENTRLRVAPDPPRRTRILVPDKTVPNELRVRARELSELVNLA